MHAIEWSPVHKLWRLINTCTQSMVQVLKNSSPQQDLWNTTPWDQDQIAICYITVTVLYDTVNLEWNMKMIK